MSNKPLKTQGFSQDIFKASLTQMHPLDTIMVLQDGRTFAYAKAGASDLAVGKLTQSAVPVSNDSNRAVFAAAAVGDSRIRVTLGGAVTADYYKDGWMHVNDCGSSTGEGCIYRVLGHGAGTTGVMFDLDDPIRVALTTSSEVTFMANRQNGVVITDVASVITSAPAGVPAIGVTAAYYFWNQVKGPCCVLTSGTLVIGNKVCPLTVNGAVAPCASDDIIGSVGRVMAVNADGEYSLINLHIPGY